MHGPDRRWHNTAWQAFRREAWQWPPGKLAAVEYPVGTSIANTDGLPLAALALKPWNAWLSPDFQFFGLWLLLCMVLQGACAGILVSLAGGGRLFQLLGVALMWWNPLAHPPLDHTARVASGWVVLAGLGLYFRAPQVSARRRELCAWLLLCVAAAAIHAYVCLMALALAAAGFLRRWRPDRSLTFFQSAFSLLTVVSGAALTCWLAGYFVVGRYGDLVAGDLGNWSMNLLAPINPMHWSRLLPNQPTAMPGQGEGFAYFGLGILLLAVAGIAMLVLRRPSRATMAELAPVLLATGVLTLVAISPKVTFGSRVLFELPQGLYAPFAPFRASGRLVLPAFYLMLFLLLRLLAHRLPQWAAIAALSAVLWIQNADIGANMDEFRRHVANRAEQNVWEQPLHWDAWRFATDSYRRLLLVPPDGWSDEASLPLAYLAARSGMTTNVGRSARIDIPATWAARRAMDAKLANGEVDPDAVYIVDPGFVEKFRTSFGDRVVCRQVDGFTACTPRG